MVGLEVDDQKYPIRIEVDPDSKAILDIQCDCMWDVMERSKNIHWTEKKFCKHIINLIKEEKHLLIKQTMYNRK